MSLDDTIANDLGRKLASRIEEIMQRETDLMMRVLPPNLVIITLMRIAASVANGAILAALQTRKAEVDVSQAYDAFLDAVRQAALVSKPEILAALTKIEQARAERAA